MGKLRTGPGKSTTIAKKIHEPTEKIVEVIKEVVIEKIVEINTPCQCEPQIATKEVIVEKPVVIEKFTEVIKEVEVPVIVTKIETVELIKEIPVVVEKEIKVYDIEPILVEKRKVESLENKLKVLKLVIASLIILNMILGVFCVV